MADHQKFSRVGQNTHFLHIVAVIPIPRICFLLIIEKKLKKTRVVIEQISQYMKVATEIRGV